MGLPDVFQSDPHHYSAPTDCLLRFHSIFLLIVDLLPVKSFGYGTAHDVVLPFPYLSCATEQRDTNFCILSIACQYGT